MTSGWVRFQTSGGSPNCRPFCEEHRAHRAVGHDRAAVLEELAEAGAGRTAVDREARRTVRERGGIDRPRGARRRAPQRRSARVLASRGSGCGVGGHPCRHHTHAIDSGPRRIDRTLRAMHPLVRHHRRHVAAAAREGLLDLMRRAREGADHRSREDTLGTTPRAVSLYEEISSMDPTLLVRGFVLGFTIAAAVGPISLLCIRRTLAEGRLVGPGLRPGRRHGRRDLRAIAAFGLTAVTDLLVDGRPRRSGSSAGCSCCGLPGGRSVPCPSRRPWTGRRGAAGCPAPTSPRWP